MGDGAVVSGDVGDVVGDLIDAVVPDYVRVSSECQGENGKASPQEQENDCRALCIQKGYEEVSQDFSVGQASLDAAVSVAIKRHYEDANTGEFPTRDTDFGYTYKEIYGDRVRFFITELSASSRFSYLARATHAGRFVALPTEAWAMYNTQVWGRSASQEVTVAEK